MLKLKQIICQLDQQSYDSMIDQFVKSKANNYLYLLKSYRSNGITDESIMDELGLNSNSFYVLKSRLFDKLQVKLNETVDVNKTLVYDQLNELAELCVSSSREIAEAKLLQLEKELINLEMHHELVIVYGYLKRINTYSDQYFHYSQLYNKQIANTLANEKTLDLLGDFNRKLAQYIFSRSDQTLTELLFLKKEIDDYNVLNSSRQTELIKYFIELELALLANYKSISIDILETLNKSQKIIDGLANSSMLKKWHLPLQYLFFEYYYTTGQLSKAEEKFSYLEANKKFLLLYSPVCLTSCYLTTSIKYLSHQGKQSILNVNDVESALFDNSDNFCKIKLNIYKSFCLYFSGKIKDSVSILNSVLNNNSFKDYFHINLEIKVLLCYLYIQLLEYDLAEHLLKNLNRKVKSENNEHYNHFNNLYKAFNTQIISNNSQSQKDKVIDNITIFIAKNEGTYEIAGYLTNELRNKYLKQHNSK